MTPDPTIQAEAERLAEEIHRIYWDEGTEFAKEPATVAGLLLPLLADLRDAREALGELLPALDSCQFDAIRQAIDKANAVLARLDAKGAVK